MSARYHIQIVRVENGWIATKNGSLFEHSISDSQPKPIWVFTQLRPMMRFLREHGVRPHVTIPTTTQAKSTIPIPDTAVLSGTAK